MQRLVRGALVLGAGLMAGALTLPAARAAAAAPASAAPPAAAAPPLMDRLFSYYQSLKDFTASFEQRKTLTAEGLVLKSRGTLSVSLGRALLWNVTSPAPLAVFMDGRTLVIRSGAGAKATTTTYDLKTSTFSEKIAASMKELTALLAMDRSALAEAYVVATDGNTIILTPKVAHQFKQVRLTPATGRTPREVWVEDLAIDEVSGDRMDLRFSPPERAAPTWIAQWSKANG